jgi:hypothetical protein
MSLLGQLYAPGEPFVGYPSYRNSRCPVVVTINEVVDRFLREGAQTAEQIDLGNLLQVMEHELEMKRELLKPRVGRTHEPLLMDSYRDAADTLRRILRVTKPL